MKRLILMFAIALSAFGLSAKALFRQMEKQMCDMRSKMELEQFKLEVKTATNKPSDFERTDEQQFVFEKDFSPDSFLGHKFGEECKESKWVELPKPFRDFKKVYLMKTEKDRLFHIELRRSVDGYSFESVCDEVRKIATMISQKYKILLKKLSAEGSCLKFTNDKTFINVICLELNGKPESIMVVVKNLEVSSTDKKKVIEENRQGKKMEISNSNGADML